MINKTISGYTIKRKLGEGGMAEVYYAENNIGKKAAVKILKARLCEDENVVLRFENEAKVMVKLEHPNITQVYDYGKIDDRPCIVMAFLEGEDLKKRMNEGERFSEEQLQKWWNQLVDTLNFTHKQGIVHRDIKPSNIFIDKKGDVKLMDFGIAKVKDAISVTSSGTQIGTLLYMSPEQVLDSKHIDYRSDVYSLAITFVHLLSGEAPYDTTTTNDYMIRKGIVEEEVDLTRIPGSWQSFLKPYLAKDPKMRPALREFEYIINDPIPDIFDADETQVDILQKEVDDVEKPDLVPEKVTNNETLSKSGNVSIYVACGLFGLFVILIVLGVIMRKCNREEPSTGVIEQVLSCEECLSEECLSEATQIFNNDSIKQKWNIDDYARAIPQLNKGWDLIKDCDDAASVDLKNRYKQHVRSIHQAEEGNYNSVTNKKLKEEGRARMDKLEEFHGFSE